MQYLSFVLVYLKIAHKKKPVPLGKITLISVVQIKVEQVKGNRTKC